MLWICIQFYMFPLNFMSIAYFLFGAVQAATGYAAWVFAKQEAFRVDPKDYKNVGTDPRRLVVYFSRMGYVRKMAYEAADRTGAEIYEIMSTERTAGTLGFWRWAAMGCTGGHAHCPGGPGPDEIRPCDHLLPRMGVRPGGTGAQLLRPGGGQIREADYILVHHQNGVYRNAAEEMDRLLGLRRTGLRSVRCRQGRFKTVYEGK